MNPIDLVTVQVSTGTSYASVPPEALVSAEYERGNDQAGLNDDFSIGTASIVLKGNDWTQAAKPFIKNRQTLRILGRIPEVTGPAETYRWTGTPGASTSQKMAGGVPIGVNLATNPKLRTNLAGYALAGATATFPTGQHATLRSTGAASGNFSTLLPVAGAKNYTVSVDLRGPRRARLYLVYSSITGAQTSGPISEYSSGLSNIWERVTLSGVTPGNAVQVQIYVIGEFTAAGQTFDARDLALVEGASSEYFDGDTPGRIPVVTPAQTVTVWQGTIGTPVTTYYRHRPPITVIPATDAFGAASKTKLSGGFVSGTYDRRLQAACTARRGANNYRRTRIGSDDTAGSAPSFTTAPKDVTHLEAFRLVRNSRRGWIWASREDDHGIVYRTPATPPPAAPVLTFADSYAQAGALYYTDVDMTHDGNGFVTAVTLNLLPRGANDSEVTQPAYRDAAALAAGYERVDETVDAYDFTYAGAALECQYWAGRQPLPALMVKSVSVDVTDTPAILAQDLIYQPIRVINGAAAHDSIYHIISEKHSLDSRGWKATYALRSLPANRQPTMTQDT